MTYRPSSLIPVSSSCFRGNESKYVQDCISRNWITQGHYVRQFEEKMSEWSGRKHAIACSSGTAALHLAIKTGIGEFLGSRFDAVAIPAMTYIATANAAVYCGANVVFTDVNRDSWCLTGVELAHMDLDDVDLILPVDLFDSLAGNKSDHFLIIEDACHSFLSSPGVVSVVSFYGSKLITTGEGGMVLTDDDNLAAQVKLYRGQGATTQGDYHHSVIGYNYRMTDVQAAIGLAQLEQIDEFILYRRMIIDRYRENLRDDGRFTLQGGVRSNGWMFALLLPDHISKERVRVQLHDRMIETRPFFRPIPSLPPYYESDYQVKYPVACELYRRGICLPTHVNLTVQDVDYICEMLKEVVTNG